MKKALAVPFLGAVVLLFLLSRMASFFSAVWGLEFVAAVWWLVFAAGVGTLFVFRKKALEFLESSAYGFGGMAITLYVLSLLTCLKYRGVVLNGCSEQSIVCVLGGGILLGLFVLLFMKSADCLLQKLRKPDKKWWIFFFAAAAVLNFQAVLYATAMKEIFVWDNAGYFVTVHRLDGIFPSTEYFKAVYDSVFETDYNYIIALPASIFCKLFGKSRLSFILAIINFCVLPLVMLIYSVSERFFRGGVFAVLAVLALPYIVFAANTGFIDIGGVFFALLAAVIYLYGNRDEMSVTAGICLAICVLLRRWYSFYALSFIITALLWAISRKKVKSTVYLVLSFAFVLLFFAQPFVSGKLMADYKDMYSAYALGVATDLKISARYFGVLLFAAVSVKAVYLQIKSRLKMRAEFFMWLQGVICFCLFAALQSHGQQHLALYVPMFVFLVLPHRGKLNKIPAALGIILCTACTASVFVPRVQPKAIGEIKGFSPLPSFSVYPPVDENAQSFLQVTEYMDGEIGEKGKTVCFLASSLEMNYDTLRNAEISLSVKKKHDIDRESYYLTIGDVDKRDGLADSLFAADYVLVPSTLQLHLAPEEQRVISVPYNHIINGTGIGEAYEKQDKVFTLASGDEIYVYKRIRDITAEEKDGIKSEIFG